MNLVDPSGYKFRWKKFFKNVIAALVGHAARQLVDPEGRTFLGAATQGGTQEATQAALNQERGVGRAFAHGAASGAATYVSTAVTAGVFAITGDAALAYQAGQATTAVTQHQVDDLLMPSAYAEDELEEGRLTSITAGGGAGGGGLPPSAAEVARFGGTADTIDLLRSCP